MKKANMKAMTGLNWFRIKNASQRPKCIFDPQEKTAVAVCQFFLKYMKKPMNEIQKKNMNNVSSIIQVKEKANYQSFQISNVKNQKNY